MTRINLGVWPGDLCDAHLIAEYREIPRVWGKVGKGRPPARFGLGAGHVLWCGQFLGTMGERFEELVEEMLWRGFRPRWREAPGHVKGGRRAPAEEVERARGILRGRICERLGTMRRRAIWTRRAPPEWVRGILLDIEKGKE